MPSVLVTGACGYLGRVLMPQLAKMPGDFHPIVALDIRLPPQSERLANVEYVQGDVRDESVGALFARHAIKRVVHLASIVAPPRGMTRAEMHAIDVLGTQNIVRACVAAGVEQFIVTSSGAAYGYHADNPIPIGEDAALRGNVEFPYSDHKRQIEEYLSGVRKEHPALKQLIFRVGTILGESTSNQITALFEKPAVVRIAGSEGPFVFVWDEDVAACIIKGLQENKEGIYNLSGDGTVTMREIAKRIGRPCLAIPAGVVGNALRVFRALGLTHHGPEQVNFLRYRTVLANDRLKKEFGYQPRKTSREAFEYYLQNAAQRKSRA